MKEFSHSKKYCLPLVLVCSLLFACTLSSAFGADTVSTKRVLQYYQQLEQGAMYKQKLANEINEVAIAHPKDAHELSCLKCHSTQGFIQWGEKGFVPPKEGASIVTKPLEAGTAFGHTCSACHDTQKNAAPDDPLLRFEGKLPKLMAGFQPKEDMGRGAHCMLCHNSNRGLYNDVTMKKMNHRAPHETAQTDVLMGQNFFFFEVGEPGVHMYVENTCSGCHMSIDDEKPTNHTFKTTFKSCSACHDDMDGEKEKQKFMREFTKFKSTIEASILSFVQVGLEAGDFKLLNMYEDETEDKDFTIFKSGKASEVNIRYFHGRQAFNIDVNGKKYFAFINAIESKGVNLLESVQGQMIAKAGWNYYMLDHDGSYGAHSPNLALEIIESSIVNMNKTNFKTIMPMTK